MCGCRQMYSFTCIPAYLPINRHIYILTNLLNAPILTRTYVAPVHIKILLERAGNLKIKQ